MTAAVQAVGLAKVYGDTVAVDDVTFEVEEGEIFGLIGPNGAGKTTLTKIVATLVQPTTGTVKVKGFDSVDQSGALRRMIGLAAAE